MFWLLWNTKRIALTESEIISPSIDFSVVIDLVPHIYMYSRWHKPCILPLSDSELISKHYMLESELRTWPSKRDHWSSAKTAKRYMWRREGLMGLRLLRSSKCRRWIIVKGNVTVELAAWASTIAIATAGPTVCEPLACARLLYVWPVISLVRFDRSAMRATNRRLR